MRLIDADALYETVEDHVTTVSVCPTVDWARGKAAMKEICLEDIQNAPIVDAVPVIRCKDCKNWDSSTEGRYVGGWCFCGKLQFSTSPDWFCADGERVDASTCGPDYCEIGGEDDADGETQIPR